jgi:hypothetical protein
MACAIDVHQPALLHYTGGLFIGFAHFRRRPDKSCQAAHFPLLFKRYPNYMIAGKYSRHVGRFIPFRFARHIIGDKASIYS